MVNVIRTNELFYKGPTVTNALTVNGQYVNDNPKEVLNLILTSAGSLKYWSADALEKFYIGALEMVQEYCTQQERKEMEKKAKGVFSRFIALIEKRLKYHMTISKTKDRVELLRKVFEEILTSEGLGNLPGFLEIVKNPEYPKQPEGELVMPTTMPKKQLVDAANELNALGIEPPCDVTAKPAEIKGWIKLVVEGGVDKDGDECEPMVEPDDELSPETRKTLKDLGLTIPGEEPKVKGKKKEKAEKKVEAKAEKKEKAEKKVEAEAEKKEKKEKAEKKEKVTPKPNQSDFIRDLLAKGKEQEEIVKALVKKFDGNESWAKSRFGQYARAYGKDGTKDTKLHSASA